MLRDNLVGLIEPMLSSAGANPLALCIARQESSDDRPPCLENPRPEGAESTLTENAPSPFHAEPKHRWMIRIASLLQTALDQACARFSRNDLPPVATAASKQSGHNGERSSCFEIIVSLPHTQQALISPHAESGTCLLTLSFINSL